MANNIERSEGEYKIGINPNVDKSVIIAKYSSRPVSNKLLTIGDNAFIRSGSVIYEGSTLGNNFETGHNVVIREENILGDDVSIWNSSTIDYGCRIGSRVKIHCSVYICQFTTIEDDVFIAPGVLFANDLHPVCTKCMKGPTLKKGARIGIGAILYPGVTIGEGALIAAGTVVKTDVPAGKFIIEKNESFIGETKNLKCRTGKKIKPYTESGT